MTYSRTSSPRGYHLSTLTAAQIDEGFRLTGNAPEGLGAGIHHWCARWDLTADTAAGMCHLETGGWTSAIALDKNNPGGVGALNHDPYGTAHSYATVAEGIMRWLAHVAAYTHTEHGEWVALDWRYDAMIAAGYAPGCVTELHEFEQKYAHTFPQSKYEATPLDQRYGAKVAGRANLLIAKAGSWKPPMTAQIPGFTWAPADSEHFSVGRGGQRIVGGAQHYSAGTTSLGWLTKDSGRKPFNPQAMVSAHLLIKTNPTMEDRGWQMVRFEDTAYTTGSIVNPKTVAIEKEHLASQTLDDMDYAVMARTWADVARYVEAHGLGDFSQGIKGHNVWVGQPDRVCPDGINVDRIVGEWRALMTPPPTDTPLHFPETGHSIGGGFKQFWLTHGGVPVFGYPLTDEHVADGVTMQWFERARFEHRLDIGRAEDWHVVLGLVGAELLGTRDAA